MVTSLKKMDWPPKNENGDMKEINESFSLKEKEIEILFEKINTEKLPTEIESLSKEKKRDLNTEIKEKKMPEDKDFFKKRFSSEMKNSLYLVQSALKDADYPAGIIGSNAFIFSQREKTAKIPDDIDMVAAIQDLPSTYSNLKKLEEEGKIINLEIVAITDNKGNQNECYEIKGKTKEGEGVEFSIFFQNINPEKNANGFVNIILEKETFYEYEIEIESGNKLPILVAGEETNQKLYRKNTLSEIALFKFHIYERSKKNFPFVSPKGLQRISNLSIYENNDFDSVLEKIEKEAGDDIEQKESYEFLKNLKEEYDNHEGLHGKGLTEYICSKKTIENNCKEKSVDVITYEIKKAMHRVYELVKKSEQIIKNEHFDKKEKINEINEIWIQMSKLYNIQSNLKIMINNKNDTDFIPFVSIKALGDDFLKPAFDKLGQHYKELQKK